MPFGNIVSDSARFRRIVKGHIRKKENLRKYISRDELIGKKGKERIRIPVPIIHIPRFKYGILDLGGVGQGDGDIGDPLFDPDASSEKEGSTGPDQGELMNVDITMGELEELLMEELGLPYLEPKGEHAIHTQKSIYKSIAKQGTRRHSKRTYKEALKRMSSTGEYKPGDPVIPTRRDFRYYAPSCQPEVQSSAVLIYMLDVSGSMGEEERQLCRKTNSWLQRIIGRYYKNLEERFIVHTMNAYEVEGSVFYGTRLSGGTKVSPAFEKSIEIINENYPPQEWNIYLFYYSDGENVPEDNDKAINLLQNLLPAINMFGYGECSAPDKELFRYEIGKKFKLYGKEGSEIPKRKIRMASLFDDEDILETLRTFLAKDNIPFYQTKTS